MTMGDTEQELLIRMDERLQSHVVQSGVWQTDTTKRIEHIDNCVAKDNIRLDRIEQREKSRAKILWAAVTGAVANTIGWIWSKLG